MDENTLQNIARDIVDYEYETNPIDFEYRWENKEEAIKEIVQRLPRYAKFYINSFSTDIDKIQPDIWQNWENFFNCKRTDEIIKELKQVTVEEPLYTVKQKPEEDLNEKQQKLKEIKLIDEVCRSLNDEDYVDIWLSLGVPDEASEEDYEWFVNEPGQFDEAKELFISLIQKAAKDKSGLFNCEEEAFKYAKQFQPELQNTIYKDGKTIVKETKFLDDKEVIDRKIIIKDGNESYIGGCTFDDGYVISEFVGNGKYILYAFTNNDKLIAESKKTFNILELSQLIQDMIDNFSSSDFYTQLDHPARYVSGEEKYGIWKDVLEEDCTQTGAIAGPTGMFGVKPKEKKTESKLYGVKCGNKYINMKYNLDKDKYEYSLVNKEDATTYSFYSGASALAKDVKKYKQFSDAAVSPIDISDNLKVEEDCTQSSSIQGPVGMFGINKKKKKEEAENMEYNVDEALDDILNNVPVEVKHLGNYAYEYKGLYIELRPDTIFTDNTPPEMDFAVFETEEDMNTDYENNIGTDYPSMVPAHRYWETVMLYCDKLLGLKEGKEIVTENKDKVIKVLKRLKVSTFEELKEEIEELLDNEIIDEEYDDFIDLINDKEDDCYIYLKRRGEVTNQDWKDELAIEDSYVQDVINEMINMLSKKTKKTEAEDMSKVKQEIEKAKAEDKEATKQEIEQVKGSLEVLKTDEEEAIAGYDTFIDNSAKVVDDKLADALDDQMQEIIQDEKDHIEKLDTIKSALDENKKTESIDKPYADKVIIYQIDNIENCNYAFMDYDFAKSKGGPDLKDYKKVAEVGITDAIIDKNTEVILDMVFTYGNIKDEYFKNNPESRSISVSDILEFKGKKYYVDSFGFKEITEPNSATDTLKESLRQDTKDAIDLTINEIYNGYSDDPDWFAERYKTYDDLVEGVYNLLNANLDYGFGVDNEPTNAVKFSGKEEVITEIKNQLADWGFTEDDYNNKKVTESFKEPGLEITVSRAFNKADGKVPETINFNGKTYKQILVMDPNGKRNENTVMFYIGEDANTSDDYFYVTYTLNKVGEDSYKGVENVVDVKDYTQNTQEINETKEVLIEDEKVNHIREAILKKANEELVDEYNYDEDIFNNMTDDEKIEEYYSQLDKYELNELCEELGIDTYNNMIQLSDRRVLWDINKDIDMGIYWQDADRALEEFEATTPELEGEIGYDGRGARHILVDINLNNILNYEILKEKFEDVQQSFIDSINNYEEDEELNESEEKVKSVVIGDNTIIYTDLNDLCSIANNLIDAYMRVGNQDVLDEIETQLYQPLLTEKPDTNYIQVIVMEDPEALAWEATDDRYFQIETEKEALDIIKLIKDLCAEDEVDENELYDNLDL